MITTTVRQRYHDDPYFRNLVTVFLSLIHEAKSTPTEIREAAMLAQIIYEETNLRPIVFTKDDVMRCKIEPQEFS